ncbi:MAG: hypothetical protein ACE15D_14825 [Candidatus Eisenbacteria bacterium]|nr:hypothetical protein [Candidatus Eisenbacteria bacterium]
MNSWRLLVCIVAAIGLLGVTGLARAETVTFDEYGSGTPITDQYLPQGVVFSGYGADPPPQIYDYVGYIGRVLISYDWYSAMVIRFVEPSDPGTYRPVSEIAFDNPIDSEVDYIVARVYDANDNLIYEYTSSSPERVEIQLGSAEGAYMILDDDQNTAYVIDNLYFLPGAPTAVESASWGKVKNLFR